MDSQSNQGNMQTQVQHQPVKPQAQAPQPIYQTEIYFYPNPEAKTIFSATKGLATIYPGWLMIYDLQTRQEISRIQLFNDIKTKHLGGSAYITYMNGQKLPWTQRQYQFYFFNPIISSFISPILALVGGSKSKEFVRALKLAVGQQA